MRRLYLRLAWKEVISALCKKRTGALVELSVEFSSFFLSFFVLFLPTHIPAFARLPTRTVSTSLALFQDSRGAILLNRDYDLVYTMITYLRYGRLMLRGRHTVEGKPVH